MSTSLPRSPSPPQLRAARRRGSWPESRSACVRIRTSRAAKDRANRILAEAETSPNYQRLLDRGEARNVGDPCAAGTEDAILARFEKFADAGVTDLSVRLLPSGRPETS